MPRPSSGPFNRDVPVGGTRPGAGPPDTTYTGGGGGRVPVATRTPRVPTPLDQPRPGGTPPPIPPPPGAFPGGGGGGGYSPGGGPGAPGLGIGPEQALGSYNLPTADIDLANHPLMQQFLAQYAEVTSPALQRQASAMGLGDSGAALEMQRRGLTSAQLGAMQQILPAAIQTRGQDIGAIMTGRGQDVGMYGNQLQAMLEQGRQALQARGQDQAGLQGALSGMLGTQGASLQQQLAALEQAGLFGGRERSIEDARLEADFNEAMRQFGLTRDMIQWPMGGATATIGQRSTGGK